MWSLHLAICITHLKKLTSKIISLTNISFSKENNSIYELDKNVLSLEKKIIVEYIKLS